eukprot:732808-Pelagomonas_calceolata.AAC.5
MLLTRELRKELSQTRFVVDSVETTAQCRCQSIEQHHQPMGNICTSSGHASAPDPKGKDAVLSNGAPPSSKPAAQAQSTQKQEHVPIHLSGPSMVSV